METFDCLSEIEWERRFIKDPSFNTCEVDSPSDSGNVLTHSEDDMLSMNLSTTTSNDYHYNTYGSRSLNMDYESSNDAFSSCSYKSGDTEFSPTGDYISSPNSYSSETLEEPVVVKKKRKRTSTQAPIHSDGFKWRKYGQKKVKGNTFLRNYYKCTFPDCSARKHIEKYTDYNGVERESVEYVNDHTHPPPSDLKVVVNSQDELKLVVLAHSQHMYDDTHINKFGEDQKFVIECLGDIDYGKDGFAWKKYGQKNIKDAFKPRQYYKCTHPKCLVKKQIESYSCTHIVITYEGKHEHAPKSEAGTTTVKKEKLTERPSDSNEVDPILKLFKETQVKSDPGYVQNVPIKEDPGYVQNVPIKADPEYVQDDCTYLYPSPYQNTPSPEEIDSLFEDFGLIPPKKIIRPEIMLNYCHDQVWNQSPIHSNFLAYS